MSSVAAATACTKCQKSQSGIGTYLRNTLVGLVATVTTGVTFGLTSGYFSLPGNQATFTGPIEASSSWILPDALVSSTKYLNGAGALAAAGYTACNAVMLLSETCKATKKIAKNVLVSACKSVALSASSLAHSLTPTQSSSASSSSSVQPPSANYNPFIVSFNGRQYAFNDPQTAFNQLSQHASIQSQSDKTDLADEIMKAFEAANPDGAAARRQG